MHAFGIEGVVSTRFTGCSQRGAVAGPFHSLLTFRSLTPCAPCARSQAPELLSGCHGMEVDVWAAGVLLYQCLSARFPFWPHDTDGINRMGISELHQVGCSGPIIVPLLLVSALFRLWGEQQATLAGFHSRPPLLRATQCYVHLLCLHLLTCKHALSNSPPPPPQGITSGVLLFPTDPWADLHEDVQDLIWGMLQRNPKRRLTASEALQHPWFERVLAQRPEL